MSSSAITDGSLTDTVEDNSCCLFCATGKTISMAPLTKSAGLKGCRSTTGCPISRRLISSREFVSRWMRSVERMAMLRRDFSDGSGSEERMVSNTSRLDTTFASGERRSW